MNEDLGLEPVDDRTVTRGAIIVGLFTIAGSLIALVPFFLMPHVASIWSSIALPAVVLFFVGAYEATTLVGDWRKKGVEMTAIGLGAAFIGYLVGKMFGASG